MYVICMIKSIVTSSQLIKSVSHYYIRHLVMGNIIRGKYLDDHNHASNH